MIFAQLAAGYSLVQLAIMAIVVCGVVGVVLIVMRQSGINLPPWVWAIIGIVALCFVGIMAIRLIRQHVTAPEQKILDTLNTLYGTLDIAADLLAILRQQAPGVFDEASGDLAELITQLKEKQSFWVQGKTNA